MAVNQTGIFYLNPNAQGVSGDFPRDLRARLTSRADPRFILLFAGLMTIIGGTVFGLTFLKPPDLMSERAAMRIQERYASIVLNQPKEEPAAEVVDESAAGAATKAEDDKPKIDRTKESYADRERRRGQSRGDRTQALDRIGKEVQSVGIFAAITAAAGSGGSTVGGGMTDLLGASDVAAGLANVQVGGGAFVTRNNVDVGALGQGGPRGQRNWDVGIEAAEVGRAQTQQIASAGSVNVTSEPPQVSGDDGQVQTSFSCIQSVVRQESAKIKRAYETWLKRDPQLSGKIKVKFTIAPGGTVASVLVVQSTMNNARFDENVTRYISRWTFTDCGVESALEIELPFVFEGLSQG